MDWLILFGFALHITILLSCFIGNIIIIAAIVRHERFKTPYHVYLLNISISDIMLMVFSTGFLVEGVKGFIFGTAVCKIGRFGFKNRHGRSK